MTRPTLLDIDDPPVYRIERAEGSSPFVLVCDHAGLHIPRALGRLGLSEAELGTHVASDLGIAGLGSKLSACLDAFLIQHNYSRLVVDANRPPGAPDSIACLSERTRIPGNEGLSSDAAAQRVRELFEPYHARIRAELDARRARQRPTMLVSLHSFTPHYLSVARRWHAGVLYGRDARLAHMVLELLRRDATCVIGDNEPYFVSDDSDYTVITHAEQRALLYVELEIRQDLLASEAGQRAWAERLAEALTPTVSHWFPR